MARSHPPRAGLLPPRRTVLTRRRLRLPRKKGPRPRPLVARRQSLLRRRKMPTTLTRRSLSTRGSPAARRPTRSPRRLRSLQPRKPTTPRLSPKSAVVPPKLRLLVRPLPTLRKRAPSARPRTRSRRRLPRRSPSAAAPRRATKPSLRRLRLNLPRSRSVDARRPLRRTKGSSTAPWSFSPVLSGAVLWGVHELRCHCFAAGVGP